MNKLNIVIPHVVKVACFLIVSGGLTALLNGIASLHLTPTKEMILMAVINAALAAAKKWQDQG